MLGYYPNSIAKRLQPRYLQDKQITLIQTKYRDIYQGFIQAALLLPIFWCKIEFSNVVKYKKRSQGAVSSTIDSEWSLGAGSRGKAPERFWPFYIWKTNK